MKRKEDQFLKELRVYAYEVETAIKFLYAYLTFNTLLAQNKAAYDVVNRTPLLWNTMMDGLLSAFFSTLGRIFDEDDKSYSIHRFINTAKMNVVIFSLSALEARVMKSLGATVKTDVRVVDFMVGKYAPSASDFDLLDKLINEYSDIYLKYKKIRNKVYAHRDVKTNERLQSLYSSTNTEELQRLVSFLDEVRHYFQEVFYNGRKPDPRVVQYSIPDLLESKSPKYHIKREHEYIAEETEIFVTLLSSLSGAKEKL